MNYGVKYYFDSSKFSNISWNNNISDYGWMGGAHIQQFQESNLPYSNIDVSKYKDINGAFQTSDINMAHHFRTLIKSKFPADYYIFEVEEK